MLGSTTPGRLNEIKPMKTAMGLEIEVSLRGLPFKRYAADANYTKGRNVRVATSLDAHYLELARLRSPAGWNTSNVTDNLKVVRTIFAWKGQVPGDRHRNEHNQGLANGAVPGTGCAGAVSGGGP